MKILIVGATGATGKNLVKQILKMGHQAKVIVRPASNIPDNWMNDEKVTIIKAHIHEVEIDEMADYLKDCQAAASCLGHNLSLKGIYMKPRKLVTDAVRSICDAIKKLSPEQPIKFVLMNTAGNRNRDLDEPISFGQKLLVGLIRILLPPHADNEAAADYLRVNIGQHHDAIKWVVVRPDSLVNKDEVTTYNTHASPTRSAIFNPGKTSHINVGDFMATLMVNHEVWEQWEGKMPVIYNDE